DAGVARDDERRGSGAGFLTASRLREGCKPPVFHSGIEAALGLRFCRNSSTGRLHSTGISTTVGPTERPGRFGGRVGTKPRRPCPRTNAADPNREKGKPGRKTGAQSHGPSVGTPS